MEFCSEETRTVVLIRKACEIVDLCNKENRAVGLAKRPMPCAARLVERREVPDTTTSALSDLLVGLPRKFVVLAVYVNNLCVPELYLGFPDGSIWTLHV
jgi:hypothetical protein